MSNPNIFEDSTIVKPEETSMICEWIAPGKNIKAKLLFRCTRDGDKGDTFHSFCDNKGPTITFIEEKNGYRVGGFTSLPWTRNNEVLEDEKLFLFSLNNKTKIVNENSKVPVAHMEGYGPSFGKPFNPETCELVVNNYMCKCLTGKMNFSKEKEGYNFSNKILFGRDNEKTYNFRVRDYEVYSIEY